jgi:predicted nucleic acid-binding protein
MKKIFVDTNILVSAYDASNPNKRQKALQLAVEFTSGKFEVCLSTQVLQEFYSVPTSKLKIPPALALVELRNNLGLNIVQVAPNIIIEAANLNITDSVLLGCADCVCGEIRRLRRALD